MKPSTNPVEDWVPVSVRWRDHVPYLQWARMGKIKYAAPFFTEAINAAAGQFPKPFERRSAPLAELSAMTDTLPSPDGFVFHLSRCGSTLVAQMLSQLTDTTVISEAPAIDSILRAHFHDASISDQQRIVWLRALLAALRLSAAGQRRFFVKFDAWNTEELTLIRRAFPQTPWIFLCRNPVDVMRSHGHRPGSHMVQGPIEPEVYGWTSPMPYLPAADYRAMVLTRLCESAHQAVLASEIGRVFDYTQLPQAFMEDILPFFRILPGPEEIERIREASRRDAKNPANFFEPQARAEPPAPAPDLLQRLLHAYEQLLKTRP